MPSVSHGGQAAAYPCGVIDDIKKRALHRTSILEGQVRGLAKMIENEDYCMDIIAQSRAVQKALAQGLRTPDIHAPGTQKVSTAQMGDAVVTALG